MRLPPALTQFDLVLSLDVEYSKSVSNYVKPTNSIFSNGLPDQYTVVAVFETNLSIKSWARDNSSKTHYLFDTYCLR